MSVKSSRPSSGRMGLVTVLMMIGVVAGAVWIGYLVYTSRHAPSTITVSTTPSTYGN